MNAIKSFFVAISEGIDIIGVSILVYGFAKLLIKFLRQELVKNWFNVPIQKLQLMRCQLGIYILLALEFLIASDIIHTIMDINTEKLIELSVMIVLRTGIGYFLGNEMKEIHSEKED